MSKISIGIMGYGNIGRGVEMAIRQNPDMQLTAIFTRRDPGEMGEASAPFVSVKDMAVQLQICPSRAPRQPSCSIR